SGLVPMVDSIARHDASGYATLTSTITECLWTIALVLACIHGHDWRQRYTVSMATDELTGLGNRRAYLERLEQECSRSRRTGTPLTLLFIDCDDFKLINDTRGHIVGNSVLRAVADSLRTGTRTYDCVARFAGDEFIVLCPRTDDRVAKCVAQRLMQLMRDRMIREDCTLTFSMGVATFEDFQLAPEEMIAAVDQTMYRTKRGSKNAVSFMCDHPSD
ncbi:MAG: GGDEF domain-containing protein, partial [Planctomycetaceae bacterium]